jgi:hypothetical protein
MLKTTDQLAELLASALAPVVIDCEGNPWILFATEDGDAYAATVPCPDDGIPARTDFDRLCARGPLRVVFNGDTSSKAWPSGGNEQGATA